MSTIDGLTRSLPRYPEATAFYDEYRPGRSYRPGDVVKLDGSIYRATAATNAIPAVSAYASGNIGNPTYWTTNGQAFVISDTEVQLATGLWQSGTAVTKETFTAPVVGLGISGRALTSGASFWHLGIRDSSYGDTTGTLSGFYGIRTDSYGTNNIYEYDNGATGSTINHSVSGTWTWRLRWEEENATQNRMFVYREAGLITSWVQSKPSFSEYRIMVRCGTDNRWAPFNTFDRPGGVSLNNGWETVGVSVGWP